MKPQTNIELIIIGGSAGSLQVIIEMIKKLNDTLTVPMVLVLHRKAQSGNILQTLLQQFTRIPVVEIEDKTEVRRIPYILFLLIIMYCLRIGKICHWTVRKR